MLFKTRSIFRIISLIYTGGVITLCPALQAQEAPQIQNIVTESSVSEPSLPATNPEVARTSMPSAPSGEEAGRSETIPSLRWEVALLGGYTRVVLSGYPAINYWTVPLALVPFLSAGYPEIPVKLAYWINDGLYVQGGVGIQAFGELALGSEDMMSIRVAQLGAGLQLPTQAMFRPFALLRTIVITAKYDSETNRGFGVGGEAGARVHLTEHVGFRVNVGLDQYLEGFQPAGRRLEVLGGVIGRF